MVAGWLGGWVISFQRRDRAIIDANLSSKCGPLCSCQPLQWDPVVEALSSHCRRLSGDAMPDSHKIQDYLSNQVTQATVCLCLRVPIYLAG